MTKVIPPSDIRSGRAHLPSPQKQQDQVNSLLSSDANFKVPKEAFYIISCDWWRTWKRFIEEQEFNPFQDLTPGPVDNSNLFDRDNKLRDHLVAGFEYQVLPKSIWNLLMQWYGGGPEIIRFSYRNKLSGRFEIEMYPVEIKFSSAVLGPQKSSVWDNDLEQTLNVSRFDTLKELLIEMKKGLVSLYNKKYSAGLNLQCRVRLYIWKYGDNFELLSYDESKTVEEVFRMQSQRLRLMLDFQFPDGSWGMERKSDGKFINFSKPSPNADPEFDKKEYNYLNYDLGKGNFDYAKEFNNTVSKSSKTGSSNLNRLAHLAEYMKSPEMVKKYHLDPETEPEISIESVTYGVGEVGLRNLGNTCYMNSVLQCLAHTESFASTILQSRTVSSEVGLSIQKVFALLHGSKPKTSVAIVSFRKLVGKFAESFKGYRQHDAEEFLTFLLSQLEQTEFKALTKQVFEGKAISELHCLSCKEMSKTVDTFVNLSLPIPTQKGKESVTLADCLREYLKLEKLERSEKLFCEKCQRLEDASKQIKLNSEALPRILILQLKRFTAEGIKIDADVSFPFDAKEKFEVGSLSYSVYGLVCHSGVTGGGHYVSYVKCQDMKWRCFNDSSVSVMEEIPSSLFSQAYLLFFSRL